MTGNELFKRHFRFENVIFSRLSKVNLFAVYTTSKLPFDSTIKSMEKSNVADSEKIRYSRHLHLSLIGYYFRELHELDEYPFVFLICLRQNEFPNVTVLFEAWSVVIN